MEAIIEQQRYVLVAPDGNAQLCTLADTEVECIGFTNLLHSKGIGMSTSELRRKGFILKKVCLTLVEQL